MKRMLVMLGLMALTAGLAHAVSQTYTLVPSNGPVAGGNILIITNYLHGADLLGNDDITNVTIGGVACVLDLVNDEVRERDGL